jgi:aspartyl-tRNA(Asn)/glutamyl-tRNA(Gln) amidotransferase subunit A
MNDFNFLTIKEAKDQLSKKKISATELLKACLAQIKKVDPKLKTFLTIVDDQELLAQAARVDRKITQGETLEQLEGIPIALKDLFSTDGLRTTAGSKIIDNYIPVYDATVVKRLKAAGAIILGKLNQDAWGHGSSGENTDYEPVRNPWDLSRVPGGSSSGSGAAVASGECLAATGTDTGSSVRLPAAFCNLTGIKPTYGRVSRYGIIAMASSLDTIGHLTQDVDDNALILSITAGKDEFDATTSPQPVPNYLKELEKRPKNLKIGIPKEYFLKGLDPKIKDVTFKAIKELEKQGFEVKEVSLPHTEYAMACYYILVPSEISSNLARFDGVRFGHERSQFGAEAKRRIMLGTYTLSAGYIDAYYKKAQKVRTLIKNDFEKDFKDIDFLIVPSSPTLPFKIGEKASDPLQMYLSDIFMCPINLAGVPSLNLPCGFIDGLPVGMQLVGPQFSENLLYQVGHFYQKLTDWHVRRPKVCSK